MSPNHYDRVIYIARAAALEGVPLERALDAHADELREVDATGLDIVMLASEEYDWLSGVVARAERRASDQRVA